MSLLTILSVVFISAHNYLPSPAEKEWKGDTFGQICNIATSPSQIKSMMLALNRDSRH